MTTATTEADILALLAGIDAHPHEWRVRTLILADACRDLGRDAVADALATDAANPKNLLHIYYSTDLRRFVVGRPGNPYGRPVSVLECMTDRRRADRRWFARMIRDAS